MSIRRNTPALGKVTLNLGQSCNSLFSKVLLSALGQWPLSTRTALSLACDEVISA